MIITGKTRFLHARRLLKKEFMPMIELELAESLNP